MANYECQEGVITLPNEIVQLAEQSKENVDGSSLGFSSLGHILKDVWGEKVQRVRRGPRTQRQYVYLNLKRIVKPLNVSTQEVNSGLSEELTGIILPEGWKMMLDKTESISFVRLERWEFNNRRATTEVVVTEKEKSVYVSIKAHGCETDLSNVGIASMTLKSRVCLAIDYIEKSAFCRGFSFPNGESFLALSPHIIGTYKDLTSDGSIENERVAYSSKCKMFSVPGGRCSECNNLLKVHNRRKQRKEERVAIPPTCNKRYLNNEELNLQLKQERNARINAERRERYWKDKFLDESVQLEDEDHLDLSLLLERVKKEKVPDEMQCLWDQQKKILKTKSKFGFRWHPK